MEEIKNIYPVIYVTRKDNTLNMETYLRKKHKGKWYLQKFYRNAFLEKTETDLTNVISGFHRDIYLAQLFGKIDPELAYSNGKKLFPLDTDQRSEEERLKPRV